MGWVRGIREVRHITVAVDGSAVGMKRGPVITKTERQVVELSAHAIERTVQAPMVFLPEHRGAGPCGTHARLACGSSFSLWWSIRNLVEPVRAYYATYVPPMRFGAKPGPRGRRAAA